MSTRHGEHGLLLAAIAALLTWTAAGYGANTAESSGADSNRFLVVDCLLPGQVRKLGGQMTYLTPRQPVRATTSECEIRGGEYIAYDRANYATALQVWQPKAEQGDPQAQTYVGEIFEKGLGRDPDPAQAAQWYQKAADQGYPRALSNLAYLYEKGLGVPQDPVKALNLYRKSAGITEDSLTFASEVEAARAEGQSKVDALTAELEQQTRAAEELRTQLASSQTQLRDRRNALASSRTEVEQLKQQLAQAQSADPARSAERQAQLEQLASDVKAREARIAQQAAELATLESSVNARNQELQQRLDAAAREDASLRQELGEKTTEVASVRAQLAAAQERLRATEETTKSLTAQLQSERNTLATERAGVSTKTAAGANTSAAELERMRGLLSQREALIADQTALIASLQAQMKGHKEQIAQLQSQLATQQQAQQQQSAEVQNARAQLASVQQRLLQTQRRLADANLALDAERTQVAAERVQLEQSRNAATAEQLKQIQRLTQEVAKRETQLIEQRAQIAALETQSRDYSEELTRLKAAPQKQVVAMRDSTGATATNAPRTAARVPKELETGDYYALIIGNNKYQYMPALDSAVNDAQALDRVLRERYRFKTRVLTDATRAQILSAINEYRVQLKERDNLLIYYAGHGELDAKIQRGYWLPVNARRDDSTEWISDRMITDQIGLMAARHVLVVADSCYSGAMTRNTTVRLVANGSGDAEVKRLVKLAKLPSRTVLTSGGEKPVLDGGAGANSIFARILIEALSQNDAVLEGSRLFQEIFDPVRQAAARFNVDQSPRYSMLADAGHLNGEFLFIPSST